MAMDSAASQQSAEFDRLVAEQDAKRFPPVHLWEPATEGSSRMRIAADGTWFHDGSPIRRPALVRVFAGIMRRDGDAFYLVTPVEKLEIEVEDAPFVGTLLHHRGEGNHQMLMISTNVGDHVVIDADHPIWVEQHPSGPRPYCHVRSGLNAAIGRSSFYHLVDRADEREIDGVAQLVVRSAGVEFPLGSVE